MSLDSELNKVIRAGTGATASFSFPFVIQSAAQLEVTHIAADGTETLLSIGTGADVYSVTVTAYPGIGSITYPQDSSFFIDTDESLVIRRDVPLTQPTELGVQGRYDPRVQEAVFDRLTMIDQQQQEELDRCVDLPAAGFTDLAGAVPRVNATEDGFEWATGLTGSAGVAGADGAPGPGGPWEFLASYNLAGLSTQVIDDIGDVSHVALHIKLLGLTVSTDATVVSAQVSKNSSVKATTYWVGADIVYSLDADSLSGTKTGTAIPITFPETNFALGNATDENLDADIFVSQPHVARAHHFRITSSYIAAGGGTSQEIEMRASAQYWGTDLASAIDSLTLNASAGTFVAGTVLVFGLRAENAKVPVPINSFTPGEPTASQKVLRYVATEATNIAADFSGSKADAGTAATASTVFSISINGTPGPTLTFAVAGTTGTWDNSGSDIDLVAGDVLLVTAPATPDATLADLSINIRGLAPIV